MNNLSFMSNFQAKITVCSILSSVPFNNSNNIFKTSYHNSRLTTKLILPTIFLLYQPRRLHYNSPYSNDIKRITANKPNPILLANLSIRCARYLYTSVAGLKVLTESAVTGSLNTDAFGERSFIVVPLEKMTHSTLGLEEILASLA
jgi:hypothetical protein